MENTEEVFHFLEEFSKRKPKTIPQELNDYLAYVARTGDPVYQWSIVKSLFKEKLLNVITDFYETNPGIEIPPYPNVDPFNYDIMKNSLIEKLDSFNSAPFTVQRICELLTFPRKQYNRIDKFMRAIEKNILVVSTREPGHQRHAEPENGEPMEPIVNGSDNNSEYNVDVEMEDMSWKDSSDSRLSSEPQPSSSDAHISVDDLEARLHSKVNSMDTQSKVTLQYESVTPPELNDSPDDSLHRTKEISLTAVASTSSEDAKNNNSTPTIEEPEIKAVDIEMKCDEPPQAIVIPEIKVDDAEMTELKLAEQSKTDTLEEDIKNQNVETAPVPVETQVSTDESSSDSTSKEDGEPKHILEVSSSEESSSSSDNTDGNSNSPKVEHVEVPEEPVTEIKAVEIPEPPKTPEAQTQEESPPEVEEPKKSPVKMQSDEYSITDVHSELPQIPLEPKTEEVHIEQTETKENKDEDIKEETKIEDPAPTAESVEP
ncbi:serine/threonine-protein phosphatase 4 regulatory subunit 2 [Bicyclus anynana]|uniref:Serine/threonine-protein phosphatase 4 regulatory subunit 2 n=1 Tax=Bicyclus anynana TaxID=110368 RepID=A0A6J1NUF8_BICAN|nr:serine/threonine-protein phosphatase 4 regulatory subunit 2 [Bicyclus anynana]